MPCEVCKLKTSYYSNNNIKFLYCSYCDLRIYFCRECGSTLLVQDNIYINCKKCGLVHEQTNIISDTEIEDIRITID